MSDPSTRASLLLRIRDRSDREAWEQFVALYRPVVVNLARHRGMQPADADDLAQTVLVAISGAIERFDPEDSRAKFRTYLRTIARRAIVNAMTRVGPDRADGGTDMMGLLAQQPTPGPTTDIVEWDYRREIFAVAADQIRNEFNESTWQAFWQSVVEDRPVEEVAAALGRSRGSVYTARSRVMMRLKQKVQELDCRDQP